MTPFPEPLGGERHEYRWRGHRVCYTRRGSGSPLVLVHSIHAAAWSMEWRHVIGALADRHVVFAIDLLGFGPSERPALHYTSQLYVELITDFLREIVRAPASIVGSSLGGTYAVRVAALHPELVRSVSAIGPAGVSRLRHADGAVGAVGSVIQGLFRLPVIGEGLFSALTSRPSIRFFLSDIYSDRAAMTPEAVELFWRGAHAPGARYAPAAFVGMRLNLDIESDLRRLGERCLGGIFPPDELDRDRSPRRRRCTRFVPMRRSMSFPAAICRMTNHRAISCASCRRSSIACPDGPRGGIRHDSLAAANLLPVYSASHG